jgi:hypothetical protein
MRLTAMLPVLYRSVQYEAGDALPADDQDTVAAWLDAGSAKWLDDEGAEAPVPKAKRKTAQPGLAGLSSDGDHDALVGRIPDEPKRKRGGKKA